MKTKTEHSMDNWNAYFKPSEVLVIYVDKQGCEYEQPVSALRKEGVLIDSKTGNPMRITHVEVPVNRLK